MMVRLAAAFTRICPTFLLVCGVAWNSGCVNSGLSTIVERSKEQPPAWKEMAAGRVVTVGNLLQFHDFNNQLPDLPLGIKKTQNKALEGSEAALLGLVRERIEQHAVRLNVAEQVFRSSETEGVAASGVKKSHGAHGRVADIYFEKHQTVGGRRSSTSEPVTGTQPPELDEYYVVHVLVQYPKDQINPTLVEIGRALTRARNPDLKRLGQSLAASASGAAH